MPAPPQEADPLPSIAVRLTPDGLQKQLASPDYIPDLIHKADPELGLVPRVSPLFDSHSTEALAQIEALAAQRDATYPKAGFELWYQIRFTPSSDTPAPGLEGSGDLEVQPRLVQLVRKLLENATVITTQFLHEAPPPPPSDGGKNPKSGQQGYLKAAPEGIDVKAAWDIKGGNGTDIRIINVEKGWNLNHEDLLSISYNAKGTAVSRWVNGASNSPAAISAAIQLSSAGDFILIEAQERHPVSGKGMWPVESGDANFELIKLATSKGVTVIEPAANGTVDLDLYVSNTGKHIFNRASPDFRESGAIMVGASSPTVPYVRDDQTNFGPRVDVFAWGENVFTTTTNVAGTDNHSYTNGFSGTSSASAIVAGAAMNVQGIVKARFGKPWDPEKIRDTLKICGTQSVNPASDRIGVMPNLKAIVQNISEIKITAVSESFVGKLDQKSLVTVQGKSIES